MITVVTYQPTYTTRHARFYMSFSLYFSSLCQVLFFSIAFSTTVCLFLFPSQLPHLLSLFLKPHRASEGVAAAGLTGPVQSCKANSMKKQPLLAFSLQSLSFSQYFPAVKGVELLCSQPQPHTSILSLPCTFPSKEKPVGSVHYIKISGFSIPGIELSKGALKINCQVLNSIMKCAVFLPF